MSARTETLPAYKELVKAFFDDEVKGKANPYTSTGGNMYSFIDDQGRICLRMSEDQRAEYASLFGTEPVTQYGAVMKGYVAIPAAALADTSALRAAFEASLAFARALPRK